MPGGLESLAPAMPSALAGGIRLGVEFATSDDQLHMHIIRDQVSIRTPTIRNPMFSYCKRRTDHHKIRLGIEVATSDDWLHMHIIRGQVLHPDPNNNKSYVFICQAPH